MGDTDLLVPGEQIKVLRGDPVSGSVPSDCYWLKKRGKARMEEKGWRKGQYMKIHIVSYKDFSTKRREDKRSLG